MPSASQTSREFVIVDRKRRRPDPDLQRAKDGLLVSIRMDMREGRYSDARITLQQALSLDRHDPVLRSLLGRCKAEVNPSDADALKLCQDSVAFHRTPETLFQLARVYLLRNDRGAAVRALEAGLQLNASYAPILAEFERIRRRRSPVIPFLPREHPLNCKMGRILSRIGLR